MKKVLVAMAIIASVMMAQGAICKWSMLAVGADLNKASAVGSTAYLINSATVALADMSKALADNDGWSALLAKSEHSAMLSAYGDEGLARLTNTTVQEGGVDKAYANGNYTFYAVIINTTGDNYMITKEVAKTASDMSNPSFAFGSQAANTWHQIVPEPTSGLLMLIGASLLALRRKQK